MSIIRIEINNYKSLKNIQMNIDNLNCLIGENGAGKTNILNAIKYFYDNMINGNISSKNFDKENKYNDQLIISMTFDFTRLMGIMRNRPETTFYKKVRTMIKDNRVILRMAQSKTGGIEWNLPYEIRDIIHYTHPFYFVDARTINLTNWNNLWEIVGDMGNTKGFNEAEFEYSKVFKEDDQSRFNKNIEALSNEFKLNNIQVSKAKGKNKMISLYQLQLGGINFNYQQQDLDYFSDGTNSGNYIKLLSFLVSQVRQSKLKEPVVIIDEPEIGLHPKLTDELIGVIQSYSKTICFIMATHSPRIIKNLLQKQGKIFKLKLKEYYTYVVEMPLLSCARARNIVTEREASYYFARRLLFVEGPTELELFNNEYIRDLFPNLNELEVVSLNSNDVVLNIINPRTMKLGIPYLILIDADKILEFVEVDNKFKLKGLSYSPFKNEDVKVKENYYYKEKRKIKKLGDELEHRIKEEAYNFVGDFKEPVGISYLRLRNDILKYTINYNLYPVKTTIEGSLVCMESKNLFLDWFSELSEEKAGFIERLKLESYSDFEMSIILRLIVGGKYDNVTKFKKTNDSVTNSIFNLDNEISYHGVKKTEGWVTEFINYVFENYINNGCEKSAKECFHNIFPEIYDIIDSIKRIGSK